MRRVVVLLALLLAAGASAGAAFDLQGHRGARGLAPENTLTAFRRALAIGVDTIENELNAKVCSGELTLAEAQRREAELKWTEG